MEYGDKVEIKIGDDILYGKVISKTTSIDIDEECICLTIKLEDGWELLNMHQTIKREKNKDLPF